MEKTFKQKNFNNFVWTPLGSRVFATGVNDTDGKFAAGVVDTGGDLPPASLTPVANLPPVSSLASWWKNLPPVSLIPVANLPPVSLIPVVHLDSRISPQFSKKFETV
jgi:hypothetical protein